MHSILSFSGVTLATALCLLGACSGFESETEAGAQPPDTAPAADAAKSTPGTSDSDGSTQSGDGGAADASDASLTDAGKSTMTFFVTSTGSGAAGANLGGLVNADKKCQNLATAVGGGDHTWVAYLGTQGPILNPRDRIGPGPWKNQKGVVIAPDNKTLHTVNVNREDILDEKGAPVPAKERAILTASSKSGATHQNNNCLNWTTSADNRVVAVGHIDSDTNEGDAWNFASLVPGCDAASLAAANSSGRIYCFAKD